MGLDRNLIDVQPSTVKKNIFVSGYSTTGVHGTKKKFSRTLPSPKNTSIVIRSESGAPIITPILVEGGRRPPKKNCLRGG